MSRLSKEKIEMIKKFCETHPKTDAVKRFGVAIQTVVYHTKGISYKKIKNGNRGNQEGQGEQK